MHLVNGVFGTLCVGLFGIKGYSGLANDGLFHGGGATQLIAQLKGVLAVGGFTFVASLAAWYLIKVTMGVRVKAEDEVGGLDWPEMGMEAYPDAVEFEPKWTGDRASSRRRRRRARAGAGGEVVPHSLPICEAVVLVPAASLSFPGAAKAPQRPDVMTLSI